MSEPKFDNKGRCLPLYQCHKTVEAIKIAMIEKVGENPGATMYVLKGQGYEVPVPDDYVMKHSPVIGGYYVRYEDGYESFSPAEPFEAGYNLLAAEVMCQQPGQPWKVADPL